MLYGPVICPWHGPGVGDLWPLAQHSPPSLAASLQRLEDHTAVLTSNGVRHKPGVHSVGIVWHPHTWVETIFPSCVFFACPLLPFTLRLVIRPPLCRLCGDSAHRCKMLLTPVIDQTPFKNNSLFSHTTYGHCACAKTRFAQGKASARVPCRRRRHRTGVTRESRVGISSSVLLLLQTKWVMRTSSCTCFVGNKVKVTKRTRTAKRRKFEVFTEKAREGNVSTEGGHFSSEHRKYGAWNVSRTGVVFIASTKAVPRFPPENDVTVSCCRRPRFRLCRGGGG